MASSSRKELINAALTAASTNGDAASFGPRAGDFVFFLKATATHADTNVDAKIQHSPDAGTTWFDLVTFTQLTDNGSELKVPTTSVLGHIRAVVALSGSTLASTVVVSAHWSDFA